MENKENKQTTQPLSNSFQVAESKNRKMAKPSSSASTITSNNISDEDVFLVKAIFDDFGISSSISTSEPFKSKDFYSDILSHLLRVHHLERGHVSCLFSVKPAVSNFYGALHGGSVAAIAEKVSIACARTVVKEDKELFLGELSISYLSAAPLNAEVIVAGTVVRSGRNLTVVSSEFKVTETRKMVYTARATFYHMPAAKL